MDEMMEDGAGPLDRVEDLIDAEDVEGAVAVIATLHVADAARVLENWSPRPATSRRSR